MRQPDTYGEPVIYKSPGWKIRVFRPILTEEERARRMKEIEKAAAALIMSARAKQKERGVPHDAE